MSRGDTLNMEDRHDDLETLGEQLYSQIYPTHREDAGKLTGMLLELPVPVLAQMVRDEAMLTAALEKALGALELDQEPRVPCKDEDSASVSSDSLGEQLFELVEAYNTGHSQKITGMLLEQNNEAVLNLLSDPKLLEEQVTVALETLQDRSVEGADVSDSSDDTENLGEKLFSRVEELDPPHANDITGMLLEMDAAATQQLLRDRVMLQAAVLKARAALDASSGALSAPTGDEVKHTGPAGRHAGGAAPHRGGSDTS
ncbi:uncharacterized protein [Antennarius striatus]|uniref:uncharacterized protein isoform X2 n=1 Tax=Antennarius striatus TaxID=241820 RepID=UPI0035B16945